MPTVMEKPVKSLGHWYDKSMLPGMLQLWCFQFGLLPWLMWILTIYKVRVSKVEKLERVISSFVKKWLGLPRRMSNIALYGKGILHPVLLKSCNAPK